MIGAYVSLYLVKCYLELNLSWYVTFMILLSCSLQTGLACWFFTDQLVCQKNHLEDINQNQSTKDNLALDKYLIMLLQKKFQFCSTVVVAEVHFCHSCCHIQCSSSFLHFLFAAINPLSNCDKIGFDKASPHARTTPGQIVVMQQSISNSCQMSLNITIVSSLIIICVHKVYVLR